MKIKKDSSCLEGLLASCVFAAFAAAAMTVPMIEEMLSDVKLHIGVDTTAVDKDYQDFWQALLVLTKDALEKAERKKKVLEELRKNSSADAAAQAAAILANNTSVGDVRDTESGIAVGVASDITAILSGKTPEELDALKESIKIKLETEEDVDSAYWEAILQKIPLFRVISTLEAKLLGPQHARASDAIPSFSWFFSHSC